jgi:hypothetical protein
MSAPDRMAPLLVVQKQRVEQAMAQVKAKNELLRQRQAQRNEAYDRWTAASSASRDEQQTQVRAVTDQLGRGIGAMNLVVAAGRREWWRLRVEECWQELAAAEKELGQARTNAMQAHVLYRKACSRQEALLTLAAKWRADQAQKKTRLEENVVEDVLANRYASGGER